MNLLLALLILLFVYLLFIILMAEKHISKQIDRTENHLIIDRRAILWSNIDHVVFRKSEMGNTYFVIYFLDDTLPKSFDLFFFGNQNHLISFLRENAVRQKYCQ
jgi:hypothetical protein